MRTIRSKWPAGLLAGACSIAFLSGCCTTPYRMYQNAYGFNCPEPEFFDPSVRPRRTTPPGPISPAAWPAPEEVSS